MYYICERLGKMSLCCTLAVSLLYETSLIEESLSLIVKVTRTKRRLLKKTHTPMRKSSKHC